MQPKHLSTVLPHISHMRGHRIPGTGDLHACALEADTLLEASAATQEGLVTAAAEWTLCPTPLLQKKHGLPPLFFTNETLPGHFVYLKV
jgi:hypothetical protein